MTFTAAVKNNGTGDSGGYTFAWIIDGATVQTGAGASLAPGARTTHARAWTWAAGDHVVQFSVTSTSPSFETSTVNNARTVRTNALSLRFYVEPAVYGAFNAQQNFVGTYSFEDWAQGHIDKMNEMLQGSDEQVFLDEVVVQDNLPKVGEHAPLSLDWDGRWGFDDAEWTPAKIQNEVTAIQGSLIHELGHQIGLIDTYNLNYDWNYRAQNEVNGETYYLPFKGA